MTNTFFFEGAQVFRLLFFVSFLLWFVTVFVFILFKLADSYLRTSLQYNERLNFQPAAFRFVFFGPVCSFLYF